MLKHACIFKTKTPLVLKRHKAEIYITLTQQNACNAQRHIPNILTLTERSASCM